MYILRCAIHTPMPMPQPVCRTCLNSTWVQYDACTTFLVKRFRRACKCPSRDSDTLMS